jgi:hypothetical protein
MVIKNFKIWLFGFPLFLGRYKIEVFVGTLKIGDTHFVDVCDPKYSTVVRSEATIIRETARIEGKTLWLMAGVPYINLWMWKYLIFFSNSKIKKFSLF